MQRSYTAGIGRHSREAIEGGLESGSSSSVRDSRVITVPRRRVATAGRLQP
ncbi:hypothetical protein [Natronococcus jeotgali]|uniref:hypothetical protein n=1 Tax=Natronococcus jeotgali TaxID=413812 RepID=UPI0019552A51|nr:hypothetical protein [Natronococcus jeotgali]